MFSVKFRLLFVFTFCLGIAALVLVLFLSPEGFKLWFWKIWIRLLLVILGFDFFFVWFHGWDYLNPKETRLPVYLGLGATLADGLIIQGISLLIKVI